MVLVLPEDAITAAAVVGFAVLEALHGRLAAVGVGPLTDVKRRRVQVAALASGRQHILVGVKGPMTRWKQVYGEDDRGGQAATSGGAAAEVNGCTRDGPETTCLCLTMTLRMVAACKRMSIEVFFRTIII